MPNTHYTPAHTHNLQIRSPQCQTHSTRQPISKDINIWEVAMETSPTFTSAVVARVTGCALRWGWQSGLVAIGTSRAQVLGGVLYRRGAVGARRAIGRHRNASVAAVTTWKVSWGGDVGCVQVLVVTWKYSRGNNQGKCWIHSCILAPHSSNPFSLWFDLLNSLADNWLLTGHLDRLADHSLLLSPLSHSITNTHPLIHSLSLCPNITTLVDIKLLTFSLSLTHTHACIHARTHTHTHTHTYTHTHMHTHTHAHLLTLTLTHTPTPFCPDITIMVDWA